MWRSSYFLHRTSQITGELRKPSQRKKKLDYIWILSKKGRRGGPIGCSKTESKSSWTLFFFLTISPPCLGLSFFQNTGPTGKAMLIFTYVTTKYSTPSQVVPLVMPFPKLSLEPL
jgi:hypothetical protein